MMQSAIVDVIDVHTHLRKGSFKTLLKSYTKHFLIIVTTAMTFGAVGLLRLILDPGHWWHIFARAVYWAGASYFGFYILIYPWYLATSKSPFYYQRLRMCAMVLSFIGFGLNIWRSLAAPASQLELRADHIRTSIKYRCVSLFWWTICIVGFTILVAYYVRRKKLLQSKSLALYTFVVPFVIVMYVGLIVREWTGNSKVLVYSPLLLLVMPLISSFIESKRNPDNIGTFDEIYIIVAGFVPFWLSSVLGESLLELLQRTIFIQKLPLGTLVIFFLWKLIILGFQKISAIIGSKASRTSDGHVFSFAAIYTGSTLAEFIFLSVTFNSLKFWALVCLQVIIIAALQGGTEVDIEYLLLHYCKWQLCGIKAIVLQLLADMPSELIREVLQRPDPSLFPLDLKLKLIKSRATVLQMTWSESEIKLSSEFQTVTCALMAVAADLMYDYFNVGKPLLRNTEDGKRSLLFIFLVSLGSRFVGQAIARRRLRQKVKNLKDDMKDAVDALLRANKNLHRKRESKYQTKALRSKNSEQSGVSSDIFPPDNAGKGSVGHFDAQDTQDDGIELVGWNEKMTARLSTTSGIGLKISEPEYNTVSSLEVDDVAVMDMPKPSSPEVSSRPRGLSVAKWNPFSATEESEDVGMIDLVDILNTTSLYTNDEVESSNHSSRRRRSALVLSPQLSGVTEDPDDWGDINLATSETFKGAESGITLEINNEDIFKMQGYLSKLKQGSSTNFQRRYCVLTNENLLIFYIDKSDITEHVGASKGIVDLRNIAELNLQDAFTIIFSYEGQLHMLKMYTEMEAKAWYSVIADALVELASLNRSSSNPLDCPEAVAGSNTRPSSTRNSLPSLSDISAINNSRPLSALRRQSSQFDPTAVLSIKPKRKGQLMMKIAFFWQEFWFILDNDGELSWYVGDPSSSGISIKRGYILTSDILSVEQSSEDPICFDINVKGHTHELKGRSDQETREWVLDFMAWIKLHAHSAVSELDEDRSREVLLDANDPDLYNLAPDIDVEAGLISNDNAVLSIIKKGWLQKKNAVYWQRRWFELVPPGELVWYGSESESISGKYSARKDSIFVANILSIDINHEDASRFDINVKGRTYFLKSDTAAETVLWFTALNSWMNVGSKDEMTVNRLPSFKYEGPSSNLPNNFEIYGELKEIADATFEDQRSSSRPQNVRFAYDSVAIQNSVSEQKPIKSGHLKLEFLLNQPHEYWFVLSRNREISWYVDEMASAYISNRLGLVGLADDSAITISLNDQKRILLVSGDRTLVLLATTDQLAAEWYHALHQVLRSSSVEEKDSQTAPLMVLGERKVAIKKSGWLQKKNALYWQSRWFELSHSGELNWFQSELDAIKGFSERKGTLNVANILSVDKDNSMSHGFHIDTKGRVYMLKASSEVEMNDWCTALTSFFEFSEKEINFESRRIVRAACDILEQDRERNHRGSIYSTNSRASLVHKRKSEIISAEGHQLNKADVQVVAPVFKGEQTRRCSAILIAEARARCNTDGTLTATNLLLRTKRASTVYNAVFVAPRIVQSPMPDSRARAVSDASVETPVAKEAINVSNIFKQGWLRKRGGVGQRSWQKRWFMLSGPSELYWFKTEQISSGSAEMLSRACQGRLKILDVLSVEQHPDDLKLLDIAVKGRIYELQAITALDANSWYNCIVEAITLSSSNQVRQKMSWLTSSSWYWDGTASIDVNKDIEGYLELRSGISWKTLWFVLNAPEVCSWFKSKEDVFNETSVGSIAISDILSVDISDNDPRSFEIFVKGRSYELRAPTPEVARRWCTTFLVRIERNTLAELENVDNQMRSQKGVHFKNHLGKMVREGRCSFSSTRVHNKLNCGLVNVACTSDKDASWLCCWLLLTPGVGLLWTTNGKISERCTILIPNLKSINRSSSHLNWLELETRPRKEEYIIQAANEVEAGKWYVALRECLEESEEDRISASVFDEMDFFERIKKSASEKKGFLMKKSSKFPSQNIKKYWFVLKSPGLLLWFMSKDDEKKSKMRGSLLMDSIDWIQEPCGKQSLSFSVHNKLYEFYALSVSEAMDWFNALASWICANGEFKVEIVHTDLTLLQNQTIESTYEKSRDGDYPVGNSKDNEAVVRVKEGPLLIMIDIMSDPVSRWFELQFDSFVMNWYLNEKDARNESVPALGSIKIENMDCLKQSSKDPCVFEIVDIFKNIYVLQAASENEVVEWYDALKVCMSDLMFRTERNSSYANMPPDFIPKTASGVVDDGDSSPRRSELVVKVDTSENRSLEKLPTEASTGFKDVDAACTKVDAEGAGILLTNQRSLTFSLFHEFDEEEDISETLNKRDSLKGIAIYQAIFGEKSFGNSAESQLSDSKQHIHSKIDLCIDSDDSSGDGSAVENFGNNESAFDNEEEYDDDDFDVLVPVDRSSFTSVIQSIPTAWNPLLVDDDMNNTEHSENIQGPKSEEMKIDSPKSRLHAASVDSIDIIVDFVHVDYTRTRRSSDTANKAFIKVNTTKDNDEFVNNLKTHSYRDLNAEFWFAHRWYLMFVVCFVTLQVLYAIAEIIRRIKDY